MSETSSCCTDFLAALRTRPVVEAVNTCPTCKRRHFGLQAQGLAFDVKAHDTGVARTRAPLTVADLIAGLRKAPPDAIVFVRKTGGYEAAMEAVLGSLRSPGGDMISGVMIQGI